MASGTDLENDGLDASGFLQTAGQPAQPGGNMQKNIIGNWKMNGLQADLDEIGRIAEIALQFPSVNTGLCIPATLLHVAASRFPAFPFGGQDCHMKKSGAHTGCISAEMLADAGAVMTIVGHSERRADQHESNADVREKAIAARDAGLKAIICIGESDTERMSGKALPVVLAQLAASVPDNASGDWLLVAYEPIWAIGTGKIPTMAEVAEMHGAIRNNLVERFGDDGRNIAILYGGSMNGENAADLLAIQDVDGGLIGGASLTAAKFAPILAAAAG